MTSFEYDSTNAEMISSVKNQCKLLDVKVISGIDPILEIEREKKLLKQRQIARIIIQLETIYRTTNISRDEKLNSIEWALNLPISDIPVRNTCYKTWLG